MKWEKLGWSYPQPWDDGEFTSVIQFGKALAGRVKTEMIVDLAEVSLRDPDPRASIVVRVVAVRYDRVQTVVASG